jgi:poly-gamma-glutamate capsule biosynthesis protein CapA/YwtB (metallophosphatase superfamily)
MALTITACSGGGAATGTGTTAGRGSQVPTATASPARSASTTVAQPEFTVVMSGDVLLHLPLVAQADRDAPGRALDFRPMLAQQKPIVGPADLAICHLETPLADADGPFSGYPTFNAPPQVLKALAATGYDACTTASNHTIDQGSAGVKRTLDALDAAGIKHTGSARTTREGAKTLLLTAGGAKVALLAYAYGTNGIAVPSGKPYSVNLIDPARILRDAKRARAAGADVVMVALHAGTEYQQNPDAQQRQLARVLTASPDIDLVYGHHVHVVQPIEKVNGKWVVYGLGNTLARTAAASNVVTTEQIMVRFTFARNSKGRYAVAKAEYIPGLMPLTPPYRWRDLLTAVDDPDVPDATRRAWQRAADHIHSVVGRRGAFKDGLVEASAPS